MLVTGQTVVDTVVISVSVTAEAVGTEEVFVSVQGQSVIVSVVASVTVYVLLPYVRVVGAGQ